MANLNDTTVSGNLTVTNQMFVSHPLAISKGGTGNGDFLADQLLKVSSDGTKWVGLSKDSNNAYPITVNAVKYADNTTKCYGITDVATNNTVIVNYNASFSEATQVLAYQSNNGAPVLSPVSSLILSGENSLAWDGFVFTFQGFIEDAHYLSVC